MKQKSGNKQVRSRIQIKNAPALMHERTCQHSSILFSFIYKLDFFYFNKSPNSYQRLKNQTKRIHCIKKYEDRPWVFQHAHTLLDHANIILSKETATISSVGAGEQSQSDFGNTF